MREPTREILAVPLTACLGSGLLHSNQPRNDCNSSSSARLPYRRMNNTFFYLTEAIRYGGSSGLAIAVSTTRLCSVSRPGIQASLARRDQRTHAVFTDAHELE